MITLDKSQEGKTVVKVVGPLDNRTAEGFDQWLKSYTDKDGMAGVLHFDFAKLDILTSRAISTLAYYFTEFSNNGGEMRLVNVPDIALDALKKLGLADMGMIA